MLVVGRTGNVWLRVNEEEDVTGPDDEDSACFIKFALNNDVGFPTVLFAIEMGPLAPPCKAAAKAGMAPSSGKNFAVS